MKILIAACLALAITSAARASECRLAMSSGGTFCPMKDGESLTGTCFTYEEFAEAARVIDAAVKSGACERAKELPACSLVRSEDGFYVPVAEGKNLVNVAREKDDAEDILRQARKYGLCKR